MVQVEFDFNQTLTVIQSDKEDTFKEVIYKYIQKTMMNPESLYFIANGKKINPDKKIGEEMNAIYNKTMKILVYTQDSENKEPVIAKSKEIICPTCYKPCRIKIENYKIKLYDCINGHNQENIQLIDFQDTQKIDLSKIVCGTCLKAHKGNTTGNTFYKCLNCQKNLCPQCKSNLHDQDHNIIKYEQKSYICHQHCESFIKYCKNCKLNLCFECEGEHKKNKEFKEHEIISLESLIIEEEEIKNRLTEIKNNIESFNNKIKKIIENLNDLVKSMETYYEINNYILNNYNKKNRNYEMLNNINEISINNKIYEEIKKINEDNNFSKNISDIISLYNKIILDKKSYENIEINK